MKPRLPVLLLFLFASSAFAQSRPPNIVLVLIDDYGWADTGSYGSTYHRTPNIDALAARGMRFTDAYAATPVCSPTRAALMTGKHPARLHLTDWLPGRRDLPAQKLARPNIRQELPLAETTLAEALKSVGYATAHIGKWHLGGAGFGPENQGFDLNIAGDHTGTPLSYFAPYQSNGRFMPGLETAPQGEYLPDRLTSEAERFIERNKEKPFFLYFPHYSVHIPMRAKSELIAKHRSRPRPERGQNNPVYAAMIESVDESVGRLTRKLEELGIADNTIFIFTSDNGGLATPEGPDTPATDNSPLRAGKGYLYEGGIRVPLIIAWPKRIKAGSVNRTPVYSMDLFVTAVEAAGSRNTTGTDGMSLLPLLTGRGGLRREALYWHYPHYSNQSINGGRLDQPGAAIRQGDYKLIEFYQDNRVELYDLKNDIGERNDLARGNPRLAERLRGKLAAWRKTVGAQMMTPNPAYQAR
ncbi:MAG: sulfatase [Acidobacteriota bacterium]|nr:MAG: sulfatase [Acidobacteriota bacterium]